MTISPARLGRTAIALACSCFAAASGWAADDSAAIRAIVDAAVRPIMAEHALPGMAVAVTVDGKAYTFNYGLASREENIPVGDATMFELGSVSKPFAATLVTYAQALGKLSLDDHPSKFMPELKGSAVDKATLLHLGTYTAGGFPLQFPDEVSARAMSSYFKNWKPDAAPGTQRRYSNPSLGLFGHLAALALQSDFADAMEKQLFPQLGLKHSYIRVPRAAMGDYAWGYSEANKPARVQPDVLSAPNYGIVSTATDVMRLVQANMQPGRLQGPLRRAVEGTQVGYFAVGPMVQGLGWEQYPYPVALPQLVAGNSSEMSQKPNPAKAITALPSAQAILFNKTGSTRGFSNYVAFVPAKKIGVVMLANKSFPAAPRVAAVHAILEKLAPMVK